MAAMATITHRYFEDLMAKRTEHHWKRYIKKFHHDLQLGDGVEFVEHLCKSIPFQTKFKHLGVPPENQKLCVRKAVLLLHHALGNELAISLASNDIAEVTAALIHLTQIPLPLRPDHPFSEANISLTVLICAIERLAVAISPMNPLAGLQDIQSQLQLTMDVHEYIQNYCLKYWEHYTAPTVH